MEESVGYACMHACWQAVWWSEYLTCLFFALLAVITEVLVEGMKESDMGFHMVETGRRFVNS